MTIDQKTFQQKVINAVNRFMENDHTLLNLKVYEPAISHRIAVYLEQEFSSADLNFDCEYNKHKHSSKMIPNGKNIRPDILVHKRDSNDKNLLALEIKKYRRWKPDEDKLKILTDQNGEFKYALGVFVYFPSNKPKMEWFCSGSEISSEPVFSKNYIQKNISVPEPQ